MCKKYIYETHGIHVGTGNDHVKHGINDIESLVLQAIKEGYPGITFVIHTPRMTSFRYDSEKSTDIKFIRGDRAYTEYSEKMAFLKLRYGNKIKIKYGIELEWLGPKLGMQWNRAKVFQAPDADFVIGSVHFSKEGIAYDGSKEETQRLLELKGGAKKYWESYIDELITMIDSSWEMIHVIGHIDLPKLYVPTPEPLVKFDTSTHYLARKMRILLERIRDYNLAIDVNLAGLRKGCGIYPSLPILKEAFKLNIPIALGTDGHHYKDLGVDYEEGLKYAMSAGYKHYVSFSRCIPEKHPLDGNGNSEKYKVLNLGIEMLNKRFEDNKQRRIPRFSFGGSFRNFFDNYKSAVSLGDFQAIRIAKEKKSITISDVIQNKKTGKSKGLFSKHKDIPGTISILFNHLASEGINVDTAYLNAENNGTATAFLTLSGDENRIKEAVEFLEGTLYNRFIELKYGEDMPIPQPNEGDMYLLEVDGADVTIPVNGQMILTVHNNSSGVLLILLAALASKGINVNDMQLGHIGDKGYAVLCVDGKHDEIEKLLPKLGPQYYEATYLNL